MGERARRLLWNAEFVLLVALAAVLPLSEALKNIFWLLYPVLWIANRALRRDWGGRWSGWDTLVILWLGGAYLSAAFAGLHNNEWGDTTELAMYVIVFWLVLRGGYGPAQLRWVLAALVAAAVAALAHGYWQLLVTHQRRHLQLHSVGHVNHSAIYLAIVLGAWAAWVFARWHSWRAAPRAAGLAVLAFLSLSLVMMESRGAIAVAMVFSMFLSAAWWPRWRAPLIATTAAVGIVAVLSIALGAAFVQKQLANAAADNILSSRDAIWRTGLAGWERYPWFGVGKDNYGRITLERIGKWRTEAGRPFEPARYLPYNHAHNLFVNTLAERGATGLAVLLAVLGAWLWQLVALRPAPRADDLAWTFWGASASAWVVTVGVGMVNTTLHHEHGMLATLLLGLWLANARRAS